MQCSDERLWLWCRGEEEADVVGDGQFIWAVTQERLHGGKNLLSAMRRNGKEASRIRRNIAGERERVWGGKNL